MGFTSLAYFIDEDWLTEAYRRTRKDGVPGVDNRTAEDYAADLEANLQSLLDRAKSGLYRAPAVKRVHIPKGCGPETRPIGIPTFEDKVLQRAVTMVLEAVYEQDFLDCSYGFRPGRSPHQALEAFRDRMMSMRGGWVLELDIEKFFDHLDHRHLRDFLGHRIRDGVLSIRSTDPQRILDSKSRMWQSHKSGSVGGLGGQPPRPTRPLPGADGERTDSARASASPAGTP